MRTYLLAILAVAVCVISSAGQADEQKFYGGLLVVTDIWARATDSGESVVFMTIRNDGEDERLAWVEPSFGDGGPVEIIDEDVALRDSIFLPGDGAVTELNSAGPYIMVLKVNKPLLDGTVVPMRIAFGEAGIYPIQVPIRAAAPLRVAKCQSESLLECGHQQFQREYELRRQNR